MYITKCEVCEKEFASFTKRRTCSKKCVTTLKRKTANKNKGRKSAKDQICFNCQRATGKYINGTICPWAHSLRPVPNWEAEKIIIENEEGYRPYESYDIILCPLFLADEKIEFVEGDEAFWQWKDLKDRLSRYREVGNGYQK